MNTAEILTPPELQQSHGLAFALCARCGAMAGRKDDPLCPCCRFPWLPDGGSALRMEYLHKRGLAVYSTPEFHGSALSYAGLSCAVEEGACSPLLALRQAIREARHFIHYTVEGMSLGVIDAFRNAQANGVAIRGVAGTFEPSAAKQTVEESLLDGTGLVVVDGMIAFRGPGVLDANIWTRAGSEPGLITVVTGFKKVSGMNNALFSPLWIEQGNFMNQTFKARACA